MWVFGGLFVLFGIIMILTGDIGRRQVWGGLSTLSLGGFGLCMALSALGTGHILLQGSLVHRTQTPRFFWVTVFVVAAAGAGCVVAGIWLIFLKPVP